MSNHVITKLLERIFIKDSGGSTIDPATKQKQDTLIASVDAVFGAVDGLELSVDNIDLDMEEVEALITSTNSALATLQSSNETHSDEEQAAIASLEAAVTAFKDAFDARDLATETTLAAQPTQAQQTSDLQDIEDAVDELKASNTADLQSIEDNQTDGTQKTQVVDGAGDVADVLDSSSDALANTLQGLSTIPFLHGYNGTTWDRLRTSGTGILQNDVQMWGGTAIQPAVVDDDSISGNLTHAAMLNLGYIWDVQNTQWVRLNGRDMNADGVGSQVGLTSRSMLHGFNGSTYDRLRSSIANGLEVDVTQSALPSGAATEAKQDAAIENQTDGTQRTGVLGTDGATIADPDNPLNVKPTGPDPLDSANSTTTPLQPGSFTAFTVDAGTDVFTSVGHGLSDGDVIVVKTDDTLPAGMSADQIYYVSDKTTDTFKLKTSSPNNTLAAYLNVTDTGTGTHSWAEPGSFEGTWTRLNRATDLFIFAFTAGAGYGGLEVQWSSDGVTQNTDALPTSNVKTSENTDTPGFFLYLDTITTDIDNYYRVVAYSGSSTMTLGDLRTWVYPGGFHGTYLGLKESLSDLSTALLTRSVLSGQLSDGTFSNVLLSPDASLQTRIEGHDATPSGALHTEGTLDYVQHDFGTDNAVVEAGKLQDLSTNGTATGDATDGGVVFSTGAAAGNTAIFLSEKKIRYSENPGHAALIDLTLFEEPDSAGISGDAYVEWGYGDGAGTGLGYGYDATGFYTFLKKGGSYIAQDYQVDWNGDPVDGSSASQFKRAGTPESLDISKDNLYRITGEFLYAAEQNYYVKAPRGKHLLVHAHEYPNAHTFTSLTTGDQNVYVEIHNDTSSGGDLKFRCGSWRGGVYSNKIVGAAKQPDGDIVELRADGLAYDMDGNYVETTDELSSSASYTSGWVDTDGWSTIQLHVTSDQVSATDGIVIEFTDDANATTPTVRGTVSSTFTADDVTNGSLDRTIPTRLDGFRVTYTNGGAGTSGFYLAVTLKRDPQNPQNTLKSGIAATNGSVMTRSASFAENDAGQFGLIKRSDLGGFRTSILEYEAEAPIRGLDQIEITTTTVGTSAVQVIATSSVPTGTRSIAFHASPANTKDITINTSAAVTLASGERLDAGASVVWELTDDYAGAIWAIAGGAGQGLITTYIKDSSPP